MKNLELDVLKSYSNILKEKYTNLQEDQRDKLVKYMHLILTFFLISFLGIVAINPTLSTISELQKQYEDSKFVDSALDKKINDLSILRNKYEEIKSSVDLIYLAIPTSAKIPYLTREIEKIAEQNSLSLKNFSVGTIQLSPIVKKEAENNYSFSFNLLAEGQENNVNNFVSDVINFDRILEINQISIVKKESNFSVSIAGRAYFNK